MARMISLATCKTKNDCDGERGLSVSPKQEGDRLDQAPDKTALLSFVLMIVIALCPGRGPPSRG